MPLPPLLAARLAKRGIISKTKEAPAKAKDSNEEVFAESYDDTDDLDSKKKQRASVLKTSVPERTNYLGHPGCPNKWNAYHDCSDFCASHWGSGEVTPEADYAAKHEAMMAKLGPLPEDWRQEFDPGTGRHFYWCSRSDRVSWLPPHHPKARVTEPASRVREAVEAQRRLMEMEEAEQAMELDSDMESEDDEDEDREIEERRRREKERRREEEERYRSKGRDSNRDNSRGNRGRGRDNKDLDPMDPASYSDAPRGDWSSGLEKARNET